MTRTIPALAAAHLNDLHDAIVAGDRIEARYAFGAADGVNAREAFPTRYHSLKVAFGGLVLGKPCKLAAR